MKIVLPLDRRGWRIAFYVIGLILLVIAGVGEVGFVYQGF